MKRGGGTKTEAQEKTGGKTLALEKLKRQRETLNARIQKMEALGKVKARKEDTRRKILIGAYTLGQALKNGNWEELRNTMRGFLKRDSDKKLFEE